MVLGRDMALPGCQIQCRDVMSPIPILELDGTSTCRKSKQLVAETDTHDWNLGGFHEAAQVIDCFLAMCWVTGTVRDEDAVEVVGDFVDWEVIWEDCGARTSADQASQDVLLDTAVDDCHVHISVLGADVEWSLGADFLDQVNLLGVDESLILIGIVFLSNGDSSQ